MYPDPTKSEMLEFLATNYPDSTEFDREAAIYWFCYDYHGGQWTNMYSALSTSPYKPGAMERSIPKDSYELYEALTEEFL